MGSLICCWGRYFLTRAGTFNRRAGTFKLPEGPEGKWQIQCIIHGQRQMQRRIRSQTRSCLSQTGSISKMFCDLALCRHSRTQQGPRRLEDGAPVQCCPNLSPSSPPPDLLALFLPRRPCPSPLPSRILPLLKFYKSKRDGLTIAQKHCVFSIWPLDSVHDPLDSPFEVAKPTGF